VIDAGESLAPHAFLTVCVDCVGLGDFFRLRVICSRVAASFFFGRGERIFFYSTDSTDTKLVKSLRRLVFKCVGGGRERKRQTFPTFNAPQHSCENKGNLRKQEVAL